MKLKIIHTADIHLDSPLTGLARYEGAPVDELRGATRRALENLVDYALTEEVDLVLIAGDVYDTDWKDYNTGQFFHRQLAKLSKAGIPAVMIRGNHDARNQITRSLRLPETVTDLSTKKPQTLRFDDMGVAVHGRGYQQREETTNMVDHYPEPVPGLFNIGLLHTALTGRPPHAPYAPCTVDQLVNKGYDYWALGHVHNREVVHEKPWIVFSGNLQGRNSRETGPKGADVVMVQDGKVAKVEHEAFDVVRWEHCHVALDDVHASDDMIDLLLNELEKLALQVGDRLLAARVFLTGRSPLHDRLMQRREHWLEEIRAAVLERFDRVWLEKIRFTTRPVIDTDAMLKRDDAIGGLLRELRALQKQPQNMQDYAEEFAGLSKKLPKAYWQLPEHIDLSDADVLSELAGEVERFLIPKLMEDNDTT